MEHLHASTIRLAEIRRALQRQEISPQTYAETLALLKRAPGLALGPMPETV